VSGSNKNGPGDHNGKSTGPLTPESKDKTKFNATTHGIFSGVVILKGESRAHYESILSGLHQVFQPQGTLEDILVDKLTTILWRHRRLILADCGEFLNNAKIHSSDLKKHGQEEIEQVEASIRQYSKDGLIQSISKPAILDRCLELLADVHKRFQDDETASPEDCAILRKIYGLTDEDHGPETLLDTYAHFLEFMEAPKDLRHTEIYMSTLISSKDVLRKIEAEISRLEQFKISQRPSQLEQGRVEVLRVSINEGAGLERLIRYEASLERAFDRTLAQLERVQRMRLGLHVAPRVEIGLNH
jgi:hypothetical protein